MTIRCFGGNSYSFIKNLASGYSSSNLRGLKSWARSVFSRASRKTIYSLSSLLLLGLIPARFRTIAASHVRVPVGPRRCGRDAVESAQELLRMSPCVESRHLLLVFDLVDQRIEA